MKIKFENAKAAYDAVDESGKKLLVQNNMSMIQNITIRRIG